MKPQRIAAGPGQESVWDYPRPPRTEDSPRQVRVEFNGVVVAASHRARRVLETAGPPVYYIPTADVQMALLTLTPLTTYCEWKGDASYYTLTVGERSAHNAAWTYLAPLSGYESIRSYIAFYPGRVDGCYVDDELVRPQPGHYYGGWITDEIVGPFKGDPGSADW